MNGFKLYSPQTVSHYINLRKGESKFGEKVNFIKNWDELKTSGARYVLFGIPEDIGVRANSGKPGTAAAWQSCLQALLNVQVNRYTNAPNLILLGEIDCAAPMEKAGNIERKDPNYFEKLNDLVIEIDNIVTNVVKYIIGLDKIPVIIGGGHNNAYGNIKGTSLGLNKAINILNIDAHTDLRTPGLRHSGNGFSFARKENFLGKYRMFGIHKNYTPAYIFEMIDASPNDQYRLFEHLTLKSSQEINNAFREELGFVSQDSFGLELDCDSIKDFPSSAQSPSGFSFNMVRNFIMSAAEEENIRYLHICEAAPGNTNKEDVGKALSYLVTDFILPS